ncbi:hypothetical protein ACFFS2_12070 [Streptomyces aurantiacus]|uniref:DUF4352 domain-containing protein n=1 Tax=Streptomyces aurantiacus TaxID=47760 RepID=A0A7G1PBP2_9ACTN|nr:hypothetical protein [Streptomyces aurantiacus]BCL32849.1 hypothetical protein GCM10017557_77080 [Streptomyces aurantiacus]
MYEPNVVGDWQEYDDEHAGLRVRVHGLEKAEPPRGRDDAAEGLVYFRFRVTVENRTTDSFGIHLEDGQIDIRVGGDGESAFLDWRNSQFIEGFDVYPLRRVTSVLYAAAPEGCLPLVDIQVQLKVDDEWTGRYLWSGGIGPHDASVPVGARPDSAMDSLAAQVISFLEREAGQGPAS